MSRWRAGEEERGRQRSRWSPTVAHRSGDRRVVRWTLAVRGRSVAVSFHTACVSFQLSAETVKRDLARHSIRLPFASYPGSCFTASGCTDTLGTVFLFSMH